MGIKQGWQQPAESIYATGFYRLKPAGIKCQKVAENGRKWQKMVNVQWVKVKIHIFKSSERKTLGIEFQNNLS